MDQPATPPSQPSSTLAPSAEERLAPETADYTASTHLAGDSPSAPTDLSSTPAPMISLSPTITKHSAGEALPLHETPQQVLAESLPAVDHPVASFAEALDPAQAMAQSSPEPYNPSIPTAIQPIQPVPMAAAVPHGMASMASTSYANPGYAPEQTAPYSSSYAPAAAAPLSSEQLTQLLASLKQTNVPSAASTANTANMAMPQLQQPPLEERRAEKRRDDRKPILYPPYSRMFVGNLRPGAVSEEDIREIFCAYGTVVEISIKNLYAFVQFSDADACRRAIAGENGRLLKGKRIELEMCKKQPKFGYTSIHTLADGGKNSDDQQNKRARGRSRKENRRSASPKPRRFERYSGGYEQRQFTDEYPLPRRFGREVPQCQIFVLDELDRYS